MTRLELDRPAVGPVPDGLIRVAGCVLCQVPPFDTADQDLADPFVRVHGP